MHEIAAERPTWGTKLFYASWVVGFVALNWIAFRLHPAPAGMGTHEQLGLPPCGFLQLTGIPCPSCGLTTAFSHIAHGHPVDAFLAQPFGVAVYVAMAWLSGYAVVALWRRKPLSDLTESSNFLTGQYILLGIMLVSWFYKIAITRIS